MLEIFGGPDRDRTDDLFHAMEARSQLRHRPTMPTFLFSLSRSGSSNVRDPMRPTPANYWRSARPRCRSCVFQGTKSVAAGV